jgi:hypothetical protein
MNIKRSYFKLLMASAGVGLFLANCTVKNSSDESCERGDKDVGCECPGGLTGHQVCDSDGVFGSCVCPDDTSSAGTKNSTAGTTNSSGGNSNQGGESTATGGKTYTAGTSAGGGVAPATGGAGAGGEGGEGPVVFPVYTTCEDCLLDLCDTEMTACLADEQCFSAAADGSGEYEAISECIETARASGLVKRDAVRSCGVTFGASSDPDADFPIWAPQTMAAATTNLLNCLATSSSLPTNADWANDQDTNFPNGMPAPWPEDSCAKLACTSAK